MQKLNNLEKALLYEFKNKDLLIEALTHKSARNSINNERLEFLGDAVLDLVVGEYLFYKFNAKKGTHNEGDLSKIRASLVNEKSFAQIANSFNLGDYLQMSLSERKTGGASKPSLLSDALEAIFGAMYLDAGLEQVKKTFIKLLIQEFGEIDKSIYQDFKTHLQELTQSKMAILPRYELVSTKGPDHQKSFEIALFLGKDEISRAIGNNKKSAEQECAKLAIKKLFS